MNRKDYKYIFNENNTPDEVIEKIRKHWYELSATVGDKGSCVLGAGFHFTYKGVDYKLSAQSPWQGSLSWERHKDEIHRMLEAAGCVNIQYNWGILD